MESRILKLDLNCGKESKKQQITINLREVLELQSFHAPVKHSIQGSFLGIEEPMRFQKQ